MLAGLLFATCEVEDRPGTLTATLPFAGLTLIEHQARLLMAAGVSQLVVMVERLTPELLGAIARIGRRGPAIDTVRTAREVADSLHPLARVLMLADGLVTSEEVVVAMAGEGGDALLVLPEGDADPGLERVGGGRVWAGIARLDPQRMAELAALPHDYDLQSTLLRLAAQARAAHMLLPTGGAAAGHGLVRSAAAVEQRGRVMLASLVSGGQSWFERYVTAPIARHAVPPIVERHAPTIAPVGIGVALGIAGVLVTLLLAPAVGLLLALLGCILLTSSLGIAALRDEAAMARVVRIGRRLIPALALLAYGRAESVRNADGGALAVAIMLVVLAALGEQAGREDRRRPWWGSPAGDLTVVALLALAGLPLTALVVGAVYATVTLVAAIDALVHEP